MAILIVAVFPSRLSRYTTSRFKRIGLEAGPLSQWLLSALAEPSYR
jgi:hypothetical protein